MYHNFRIAVTSNENDIHVWDLTEALDGWASAAHDLAEPEQPPSDVTVPEIFGESVSPPEGSTAITEPSTSGDVIPIAAEKAAASSPVPVLTKPKVVLSGHFFRVVFVTWSPHKDGQLLSVSYDNSARVSQHLFAPQIRSINADSSVARVVSYSS